MQTKNIVRSLNSDAILAVKEIKEKLSGIKDIKCIIFFASYLYDSDVLAAEMAKQFPGVGSLGSSSNKELTSDGISTGALVAIAFTSDIIADYHIEVVENLSADLDLQPTLNNFAAHYNRPLRDLEPNKYFGLVFMDFNNKAEDKLFNEFSDSVHMVFMGGTASDEWLFTHTGVYANGKYYKDAAVIALFQPKKKFAFEKMESVEEVGSPLTVTKSDFGGKKLYEIDGRPAAEVYCEMNGLKLSSDIMRQPNTASAICTMHPLGIKIEGQTYLREVFCVNEEDKSITMLINIPEGLVVHFFKAADDIVLNTTSKIDDLLKKYNNDITSIIAFTCSARLGDAERSDKFEEYSQMYSKVPCIGFYTFGEYFIVPVNHTSTLLILLNEDIR